ncbi:MAG: HAMP domain-containing protein [Gammaproteobacteria bacterium]|nr:HAMP domain-containing protein [Gammaproteobacteria bacterium]
MSFRLKTILGIAFIESILLLLLIWMGLNLIRDTQEEEFVKRASTIAQLFATTTKDPVLSSDLASLESFTDEVMKNPGLVYARVLDQNGFVMVERSNPGQYDYPVSLDINDSNTSYNNDIFNAQANIYEAGQIFGQVQIGLSNFRIHELLAKARSDATILAISEMSLVALFSFVLGSWLTRQLKALEYGAHRVSEGKLGHQVQVKGNDELAKTTRVFNMMSQQVKQLYEKLSQANTELKSIVVERTNELQLLYKVSSILADLECPLEDLFNDIVYSIIDISVESDKIGAGIFYEGVSYQTDNYFFSENVISSPISINGEIKGFIEITYSPDSMFIDAKGIEVSKKPLLDTICQDVCTNIAHRTALRERQKIEMQLHQALKLESVGQLAAGIAHEINSPTQFVSNNVHFLQEAFNDYIKLIEYYTRLAEETSGEPKQKSLVTEIHAFEDKIDIEYLAEEIPQAIEQSLEGLRRITKIVTAMKEFSHPGSIEKVSIDINKAIETTINVSHNEWKYIADLIPELDPLLPNIPVLPDEFNQVILNLIVNAAHAIEDGKKEKGEIHIRTYQEGEDVIVAVSDNGCGMSDEIKKRVFDPFFTTKEVGKGSGQGLAIVYSIIVDKHRGSVEVETEKGKGSRFIMRLPMMITNE